MAKVNTILLELLKLFPGYEFEKIVNSTRKCNSTALIEGQAVVGFVLLKHSKKRSTYEALPPAHPDAKVRNIFVVEKRT